MTDHYADSGKKAVLKGIVVTGAKKAAAFTRLDWVQAQCMAKLNFRPYPGTLNVELNGKSRSVFEGLGGTGDVQLSPPDPNFCEARVVPAVLEGIPVAIIIPAEAVRIHGSHVIEVLAPIRLRDALHIGDGDTVSLILKSGEPIP